MIFKWKYVKDENECKYIINAFADLEKGPHEWFQTESNDYYWFKIEDNKVSEWLGNNEVLEDYEGESHLSIGAALLLDLSTIPEPSWSDNEPITIIQKLENSQTYYIEE